MDKYFKKKFIAAMMNDMACDEPDIGLNLFMMEIEAETICVEIGRIGLEIIMEELMWFFPYLVATKLLPYGNALSLPRRVVFTIH